MQSVCSLCLALLECVLHALVPLHYVCSSPIQCGAVWDFGTKTVLLWRKSLICWCLSKWQNWRHLDIPADHRSTHVYTHRNATGYHLYDHQHLTILVICYYHWLRDHQAGSTISEKHMHICVPPQIWVAASAPNLLRSLKLTLVLYTTTPQSWHQDAKTVP